MIPSNFKTDSLTQPSRAGFITPIVPVTVVNSELPSPNYFTQGEKYQALIVARQQNGNARILISGQLLQIQLPCNLHPGNKIDLVFIEREPQLKFLLQNLAPHGIEKNLPIISATGRLLSSLIQDIKVSMPVNSLIDTTPILANPPINSTELPSLLQKALTRSGLFYESHLAQWAAGKNTLARLKQEPQNKLTIASAATSTLPVIDTVVHAESLPLVQQQLVTLETGHLVWRGEIWPGQFMEWDISEHPSNGNEQETGESATCWQMQLRLILPMLGEVTAKIVLNACDIHIKLHTATMETAELLKENRLPLATAITLAGLSVQITEIITMATNEKSQIAVALAYRSDQSAPLITAKGHGLIAEEIIKRAKESGVYVHESVELVTLLAQIDLDERIPPQLYTAVAELLVWVYRLEHNEEMLSNQRAKKNVQT